MFYDPAWDMPRENWQQQGSFEGGVVPPTTNPDAGTQVCIGPFALEWLPYVLGAMDQLRNPSSWIVADDDALYATLNRVTKLRDIFSLAGPCVSYELRFTEACVLESSTDGGETWMPVTGWDANFAACVAAHAPPQTQLQLTDGCTLEETFDGGSSYSAVAGWSANFCNCVMTCVVPPVPPDPGHDTILQRACNIASYMSKLLVNDVIDKAISSYNDDLTLLQFGLLVFDTIAFAFPITAVAVDVFAAIYVEITSGNIADFEAASTDPLLISLLTCAIYNAIKANGYITSGNLAAVITNVCGITYTYPVVITFICDFITNIGIVNLRAMQAVGALDVGDCTFCSADWCKMFDFTVNDGGWHPYNNGHFDYATYTAGVGWTDIVNGPGQLDDIFILFGGSWNITTVDVWYSRTGGVGRAGNSSVSTGGGPVVLLQNGVGTFHTVANIDAAVGEVEVGLEIYPTIGGDSLTITKVEIRGLGTSPFGISDCAP